LLRRRQRLLATAERRMPRLLRLIATSGKRASGRVSGLGCQRALYPFPNRLAGSTRSRLRSLFSKRSDCSGNRCHWERRWIQCASVSMPQPARTGLS
jgi:hypothetical protein